MQPMCELSMTPYTNTVVNMQLMKNESGIKMYLYFSLCRIIKKLRKGFQFGAGEVDHLKVKWD